MLNRADRGYILLWAMIWLISWGFHWILERRLQTGDDSIETLHVRSYIRLFFGLKPSNNILSLRPAIGQILAAIMTIASIFLRRLVTIQNPGVVLLVFLGIYWILAMAVFKALDRRNRGRGM